MKTPDQRQRATRTVRSIALPMALAGIALAWVAAEAATPAAPAKAPLAAAPPVRGPAPDGAQAYREECAACHIAFPARLLSAASWRAVIDGLGKHFGVDASLDATTTRAIGAYLEQSAGYPRRGAATGAQPLLRITETEWFRREHHELTPSTLQRHSATSAADCAACHQGAAQGEFEHEEHGGDGERRWHDERGERDDWQRRQH